MFVFNDVKKKLQKSSSYYSLHFIFLNDSQILDGVTLANLDVTENSSTGTLEGTLIQRLDQCSTPFGMITDDTFLAVYMSVF